MSHTKILLVLLVILLMTGFIASAGCLSTTTTKDYASESLHSHYDYEDTWSPGYGCYTHLTGYVYNAANESVENARLNFNLVNTRTGTIRDSQSVYVGHIGIGETRTYEMVLDGECTQDYRIDFSF